MGFTVGTGDFLVCYLIIIIVREVGLSLGLGEEEGEFVGASVVEAEGVGL